MPKNLKRYKTNIFNVSHVKRASISTFVPFRLNSLIRAFKVFQLFKKLCQNCFYKIDL